MAQMPVTSNTYSGEMRSNELRDQDTMSGMTGGMDERDMMYNNMLGYRVNTYQDDSCKDAHEVCTNLTSFCNNAGIATMCKSACGLCTPTTGRSFQQIADRDMFNVNQAMNAMVEDRDIFSHQQAMNQMMMAKKSQHQLTAD